MAGKRLVSKEDVPILNLGLSAIAKNPRLFLVLAIQLALIAMLVFFIYKIVEPSFEHEAFVFSKNFDYYLDAAMCIFALLIINTGLKIKGSTFYHAQAKAAEHLSNVAKSKIVLQKENPFALTMFFVEAIYIILIAVAIYYYLDPESSLEWWKKFGLELQPPLTTIANAAIFIAITAAFIWFHSYARQFDTMRFKGKKALKKIKFVEHSPKNR